MLSKCKISESSSFVYGAMGFVEKAASGVAFLVLQNNSPTNLSPCEVDCDYFKYVVACTCGGFSLFGLTIISILYPMVIGKR